MSIENQQTDQVGTTKDPGVSQSQSGVSRWQQPGEPDQVERPLDEGRASAGSGLPLDLQDVQPSSPPSPPGGQAGQEGSVQPQRDGAGVAEYAAEDWLTELAALTVQGRQQMDRIEARVEALTRWPERLERRLVEAVAETAASRDAMEGLQREMKRVGRHQFKTNTLDEQRVERWRDAIETLESALSRREGEIAAIRFQQRQAVEAALREWMSTLLPVLDGLEDAFAAGCAQMDRLEARYDEWGARQSRRRGLFSWFRRSRRHTTDPPDHDALTSLNAWLDGLRMSRDRVWALLEEGGVRAIPTVGHPFDPHLHIAVGTVDRGDVAAGLVVEEQRRGYRVGDRVVRFSEVIVARLPAAHEMGENTQDRRTAEE